MGYRNLFVMFILVSILQQVISDTPLTGGDVLFRKRRQLLFPNVTLLQLNAGVGTPTPIKTINVNWAFQANFMLPWNRSQIPVDILGANSGYNELSRKKREVDDDMKETEEGDYENDAKLYHFYKYVEDILNGYGDNGTACVLQALCQIAAEPLQDDDEEDLLHELGSFVLNPTNDITHGVSEKDEIHPYVAAYERGETGEGCIEKFGVCSTSLVDMITILTDRS